MQGSLNSGDRDGSVMAPQNALPPVFWALPMIALGLVATLFIKASGEASHVLISLLGVIYLYWLLCVFRIHQVLARRTDNMHPVRPGTAIVLNVVAGPAAAFVAAQVCTAATRMVVQANDLIGEVMPNCLPIANSAVLLMQQYGVYLAVALACLGGISCQIKALSCLRRFCDAQQQGRRPWTDRNLAPFGAAVVGVSLVAPGCLWLLGTASAAPPWTQRIDSGRSIFLLSFACCFLAFAILCLITNQLAQALSRRKMSVSGKD